MPLPLQIGESAVLEGYATVDENVCIEASHDRGRPSRDSPAFPCVRTVRPAASSQTAFQCVAGAVRTGRRHPPPDVQPRQTADARQAWGT